MNTIGWLFVFVGLLVFRSVSKGRGITDIPKDLGDILTGALTNDPAKIREVLSRKNDVSTPVAYVPVSQSVDAGFQLGTAGQTSNYDLGNVKPILIGIANDVGARFHPSRITGVRANNGTYGDSEHSAGRAIDVFVNSKEQGDAIVNYVIARPAQFDLKYVIWYQRIWYPGSGWRSMPDRGGVNENHMNHVHINVN